MTNLHDAADLELLEAARLECDREYAVIRNLIRYRALVDAIDDLDRATVND